MKKCVNMAIGNPRGMTLIELLVVMAIIGILIAVGANMVGGVLAKYRLSTAAEEVSTRLKAAQMLAVVHNKPVTVVFTNTPGTSSEDSYYACLDGNTLGDCTEGSPTDEYLNLDSGRKSTFTLSEKKIEKRVDMYAVAFDNSKPQVVTYMPPSGLVVQIMSGGLVNGVVCFKSEIDDSGDWDARYSYRRVTVNPVVGRTAIWKNALGIGSDPSCRNNPEDDAGWERID